MVSRILEGKTVNLRVVEKEDLPLVKEWFNDPDFSGEYDPLEAQESTVDIEKKFEKSTPEQKGFLIETKTENKIGFIGHFPEGDLLAIGYALIPNERGKGYCTEALQIMVDYLFLSKKIVRIQARTNVRNKPSQRVLERNGFKKEGTLRKSMFVRGEWVDTYVYSILREEWIEPKILTKST